MRDGDNCDRRTDESGDNLCDDHDPCTRDRCDPSAGCLHAFEDLVPPPVGSITDPTNGFCTDAGVTVLDDFTDVCDPAILRSYSPVGGPVYGSHGDYHVVLTAQDHSGNAASASVDFTIDRVPPAVRILNPAGGGGSCPEPVPIAIALVVTTDSQ